MKHLVLISCWWLLKKMLVITTNLINPESASAIGFPKLMDHRNQRKQAHISIFKIGQGRPPSLPLPPYPSKFCTCGYFIRTTHTSWIPKVSVHLINERQQETHGLLSKKSKFHEINLLEGIGCITKITVSWTTNSCFEQRRRKGEFGGAMNFPY